MKTVFDYGAIGDGVADDTAAFQEAASHGYVDAPYSKPDGTPATYRVTDTIAVPGGQVTLDGTVDATDLPPGKNFSDGAVFEAKGSLAPEVTITSRIAKGQSVINVPNDFSGGDFLIIRNNERPVPGMTGTNRGKGEIKRLISADETKFQFSTRTYFSYGAPSAVKKMMPVEVEFSGRGKIVCGGVGSGHIGISIAYGSRPVVRGLSIFGAEDTGVKIDYCWAPLVEGVRVEDSTSPSYGFTGYGVLFGSGTTGGRATGCVFFNCRHGLSGGGHIPAMYCSVDRCFADVAILDCHEPCFEWQFFGNTVLGGADALLIRGQHIDAVLNRTYGNSTGVRVKAWEGVTVQDGVRSLYNRVRGTGSGVTADGRPDENGNPISHKPGLEIIGDRVEETGHGDNASVTLAHATEAIVDVTTRGNLGAAGVEVINSRLRSLAVLGDDAATPVKMTNSTVSKANTSNNR